MLYEKTTVASVRFDDPLEDVRGAVVREGFAQLGLITVLLNGLVRQATDSLSAGADAGFFDVAFFDEAVIVPKPKTNTPSGQTADTTVESVIAGAAFGILLTYSWRKYWTRGGNRNTHMGGPLGLGAVAQETTYQTIYRNCMIGLGWHVAVSAIIDTIKATSSCEICQRVPGSRRSTGGMSSGPSGSFRPLPLASALGYLLLCPGFLEELHDLVLAPVIRYHYGRYALVSFSVHIRAMRDQRPYDLEMAFLRRPE